MRTWRPVCCAVLCCTVLSVRWTVNICELPAATLDLCACSLTVQDWPGRQTRLAVVSARSLSLAEQSRDSTSCSVQPGPTALCAAQLVRTCQTLLNPSNRTFYDWSGCRDLWLSCRERSARSSWVWLDHTRRVIWSFNLFWSTFSPHCESSYNWSRTWPNMEVSFAGKRALVTGAGKGKDGTDNT